MAKKDGVLSIGIEYKTELNKMIADLEGGLDTISKNNQLSKGMKQQFDNVIAEVRNFKVTMEKELATLGSGKVDKTAFKSFKQIVANNFKSVREDIDRLDLAVSTLNSQMEIISNGVDLSKITKEFAGFEDYVNRTNDAVLQLIDTLGQQGISLFSFDNRNILDTKNKIKEIENIINQLDTDKGAKFELFDEKEAQSELDRLSVQLRSTLELMEHTEKQMSNMDNSTVGFKKMQGDFALLQLKAASLNDTIEMLYTVMEGKGISIEMDDKSFELYDKYTEDLSDNLESIVASAKNAKKELSSLLVSQKQSTVKVSSEMNPNSSELATTITIETTSSELWKKLSPILTDLQGTLNSNPVVAPVKLVVAPNAVSSTENGDVGKVSNAYSKKYAKVLAETGKDAVIDLEGVYKKTFTSIMDAGVSYAKETISKIQDIFDKSPISIKYDISQEEIDKIQNFVLSNKDGKKVDISGQITKAKQEVDELNANIEKTSTLLQETKSKGNVEFDGFDKFTQNISKSIVKLEELQNILKALQNIEITLAKASGLSSITEIENQWENLEKRIINATKVDGSFRKNASINKIASEYQKYIDMGGTNTLSDISKIQENKDTIEAIISKAKEFQKQDFTNDSIEKLSIDLDGIIAKFDELISTVKTATNALYKIIRDGNVSDLDKQWSSISNKFKSIADESGKINLTKQKKDIRELIEMYQKYLNAGGMKSLFDLTDNTETLAKLNKVYSQINSPKSGTSSVSKEKGTFDKVQDSVDNLTNSINTKTDAIKTEANTMELAARAEVKSIGKIITSINQLIERIESISNIKVPEIKVSDTISSDKSNISSGNTTTPSEVKNNEEVVSAIRKKKEELASYELKVEELRYEIEKLSKIENESYGFKKAYPSLSDKQIDSFKERIYNSIFGTDKSRGYGLQKYLNMGTIDDESVIKSYRAWSEELDKVGYKLSELRQTSVGVEADILPIDGKAITNAEEFRKALSNITTAPSENVELLNKQITELEAKISSLKSEISSLESSKNSPMKDVIHGDEVSKINEVAEATNNLADAENRLSIIEDKKSAQNYWQGRFKESVADMTKTNEELAKMNQYYSDLESKTISYQNSINKNINTLSKYTDSTKYTEGFISRVNLQIDELKKINLVNENSVSQLSDIESEITKIISDSKLLENRLIKQDSKLADIISKMKIYRAGNTNMSSSQKAELTRLIDYAQQLEQTGKVTAESIENIKKSFSGIKSEISETGKTGLNAIDRIVQRSKDMNAKFFAQFFSFQDWIRYLREGFNTIRELDTALTEMRKVSDESVESLKRYQATTFDVGDDVGATAKTIQNSTADWMRLGESIDEASESAKVSNILLNVSEFDNIDEATKSLVSMSQAYQELDKIDIVNKINNIGNNFSIATDELARGMQNAAAVLKTQGNDIDKAISLITAGNAITQDAEKTSAGIRTIALRIAGTEEAKDELQEMGEDVDDFVVKTSSKTQQIIKDYTAVASNAYKGIDVLDANGNLRDTYDILLDIARIYKEIQEEDKKAGTNRAQALVEELAGKNRSNIASSILLNPQLLEDVYKTSQNSANSAQNELNAYLDSIDGRMTQLENRAQEFWYKVIDSDTIKNGITLLTDLLELGTNIVDTFGVLPTIMTGVGAGLAFKNIGRPKMFGLCKYADINMCSLGY